MPDERSSSSASSSSQHLREPTQHALRATESRFSLHEQFATTRRDYEFGDYDDSSSIVERITTPSESGQEAEPVGAGYEYVEDPGNVKARRTVSRDYYELLCIPRDGSAGPDDIRKAYYRLFYLLHAVEPPASLRALAEAQFQTVQKAFETLIEPYRRLEYDTVQAADRSNEANHVDDDGYHEEDDAPSDADDAEETLQDRHAQEYLDRTQSSGELAVRLDATNVVNSYTKRPSRGTRQGFSALDVIVRQSTTIELPSVSKLLNPLLRQITKALHHDHPQSSKPSPPYRASATTLSIGGSVHAFKRNALLMSSTLIFDDYRPPGAVVQRRSVLRRLLSSPFLPQVDLRLRQELAKVKAESETKPSPHTLSGVKPADLVIEVEGDFSPQPTVITRVGGEVTYPGFVPFQAEVSTRSTSTPVGRTGSVGLALHRRFGHGIAFVTVDGGDWSLQRDETCHHYSIFSQLHGKFKQANIFLQEPTAELGYTFSANELGLAANRAFTRTADRGIRGLDRDLDIDLDGSWTVSAAATSSDLAAYARYGKDLFSSVSRAKAASLPPGNYSHRHSGVRGELEVNTSRLRGHIVVLRGLKRVGRFSRIGIELGVTPQTLHLSLYWSRLGQRFSLPFLVSGKPDLDSPTIFWTAVASIAGFAALEAFVWRRKQKAQRKLYRDLSSERLQELIAARRTEADEMTALLAGAVDHRQRHEKERGGLVILSAKYGVKDATSPSGWSMEEVADVTIAVGALVDDGALLIPQGLRKSHILGFWDPAPTRTKILMVSYTVGGKQQSIEVKGREELRLP
jgi:DnaJ homolog subfamily C member 11